jgi:ABC-2 type transport system permease protein
MLVLSGLTRLLYGIAPRAASLAWLALAFCSVVLLFGQLFRFPRWLLNLSPFQHLALTPAQDFTWVPFLGLLTVAALLSAAGQLAFQRRDVN